MAKTRKHLIVVPTLAVAALLAGCAGDGVELQGPGFEALGLTSKKKAEPKVPDRAPLLLPPDRARLPEPQQATAAAPPQNWPTDAQEVQKAEAQEKLRKQKEYQDKGNYDPKADIDEFEKLMDPLERQPGIFGRGRLLGKKYRDARDFEN
ncbi:MAG: hypothetical protein MPJ78_07645 [Hyphomicrobiaceae bacterium]|nr:hypothetical protein [Hyphomicrobiaceae bacterium]